MSNNIKNLSMSLVKKQDAQKFKDKKRVNFDNAKVDVDVVFRPSKRGVVVAEMMEVIQQAFTEQKKIDAGIGIAISTMLIIKHFTSIETDASDYDGFLEMTKLLNDGDYTSKILESFEPSELEKMFEELNTTLNMVTNEIDKVLEENKEIVQEEDELDA
jgi:hypothetical protein